jgi:anti-anti-sigma factor
VIDVISATGLDVRIRDEGEAIRVLPRGEIDLASVSTFRDAIALATRQPARVLIVDLRDVTFMDARGLAELVSARGKDFSRDVFVVNPRPMIRRIMRVVGLAPALLAEPRKNWMEKR